MAQRGRRTTDQDYIRLAENIKNQYGRRISDRDSFDFAYNKYLAGEKIAQQPGFRDKVFRGYRQVSPKTSPRRERPEMRQATKLQEKSEALKAGEGYIHTGQVKGKIVKARKDSVKVKGKTQVRYRNRKGQFVSIRRRR